MRVGVLFSGGKDSTFTVWLLQHQAWDIPVLVTVEPSQPDSLMFHYPTVKWTRLQAEAIGIQHVMVSGGGPEAPGELAQLEQSLSFLKKEYSLDGLATGAVASDYQRTRFDRVCDRIGLKSYSPLWHKKPGTLVDDLVGFGFKVIITGVGARGLDESWLGRMMDREDWDYLKRASSTYGIHLTGEGGEYESFVTDGPNFHRTLSVRKSYRTWDGQSGYLTIQDALLVEKSRN